MTVILRGGKGNGCSNQQLNQQSSPPNQANNNSSSDASHPEAVENLDNNEDGAESTSSQNASNSPHDPAWQSSLEEQLAKKDDSCLLYLLSASNDKPNDCKESAACNSEDNLKSSDFDKTKPNVPSTVDAWFKDPSSSVEAPQEVSKGLSQSEILEDMKRLFSLHVSSSSPMATDSKATIDHTMSHEQSEPSVEPSSSPPAGKLMSASDGDTAEDVSPEVHLASFPFAELTKLDQMISWPRWIIPVLPKGQLEVLLQASINLAKRGLDSNHPACQRFYREGLTISFTRLLNDEAVNGWKLEIHVRRFHVILSKSYSKNFASFFSEMHIPKL